ncbi:phage baseplate upper protein [Bacillus atrophaeus]|uniref:phage baseplate upper protein n=1 Tax=Bacillus atrophaeus TaxID=1452 RepID=UPI002280B6E1|nr:BppU family phage baseplate upper protein [Bacillus atrophaeus]MCY9166006.1 BppU family phage baseplate upper protein [Bacillus atrophaeus]
MIFRQSALNFDITSYSQSAIRTNIQMSTQDKGTAKLVFYLKKDGTVLPLSGVKAVLTMFFADGSRSDRDLTLVDKVNGIAEYVLSNDEIKHYGKVDAVLNLYYVNKQALSAHEFTFEIIRNLVDRDIVPTAEYYIDDFEKLKVMINKLYDETVQTVEDLRKKFEDLENVETKEGAQEKADAAEANAKAYTDTHANNKKNPHAVTKAQVGLANVDNVKQAAQTDFDAHTADKKRHITADERSKWNGSQLSKITSDSGRVSTLAYEGEDILQKIVDQGRTMGTFYSNGKAVNNPSPYSARGIFHMTALTEDGKGMYGWVYAIDYKNNAFTNYWDTSGWQGWKRLETTSGSQSKVDAHANKTDIHVKKEDKDKWNGAQLTKLTGDDGKRTFIQNGTDILTLTTGFYQGAGTSMVNSPIDGDGSWFNYDVIEGSSGRKSIQVWKSYDNIMWHGTVHTDGVFKGWKRLITNADFENETWQNITLKNGAVAGNRMPIYARWGPFLLFRGHVKTDAEIIFGSIPEAYVPVGGAVVSIALSGTGGTANLVVYENGDLKIKYPNPVDPSKFIGGYYIDAVIGFQGGGTA